MKESGPLWGGGGGLRRASANVDPPMVDSLRGREHKRISSRFPPCTSTNENFMDLHMAISIFDIFVVRNSGFLFAYSMFYILDNQEV